MELYTMSTEEWAKIPDCTVQRNTEAHATKALRHHLANSAESQALVVMAQTPKGQQWKIDGHTRCLLWEKGLLEKPPVLNVVCYTVNTVKEAEELYYQHDNSTASETGRDKIFGAFRHFKFFPNYGYIFLNCGLTSAIDYCVFPRKFADLRMLPLLDKIEPWIPALKTFDSGEYHSHVYFRSCTVMACLMMIRADGNKAMSFIQGYADDIGKKHPKSCDGIFAARSVTDLLKHERRQTAKRTHGTYGPYYLYCYDQWKAGNTMQKWGKIDGVKKLPKGMRTVREWWRDEIGEIDHPTLGVESKALREKVKK